MLPIAQCPPRAPVLRRTVQRLARCAHCKPSSGRLPIAVLSAAGAARACDTVVHAMQQTGSGKGGAPFIDVAE